MTDTIASTTPTAPKTSDSVQVAPAETIHAPLPQQPATVAVPDDAKKA